MYAREPWSKVELNRLCRDGEDIVNTTTLMIAITLRSERYCSSSTETLSAKVLRSRQVSADATPSILTLTFFRVLRRRWHMGPKGAGMG
jgi:small-conductance mechanosensitive channel